MPTTTTNAKMEGFNFASKLVKKYLNENKISRDDFAYSIGVSTSALNKYLSGEKEPGRDTLIKIAYQTRISLDALCGLDVNNVYNEILPEQFGLPHETANYIKKYLKLKCIGTRYIKKDNKYKRILNLFLTTKIRGVWGNRPFIEIFNESVLELLISSIINDKIFMELFIEHFNTLSPNVNKHKTEVIKNNTDAITTLSNSFEQILHSKEIKPVRDALINDLKSAIEELFKTCVETEFNNAITDKKLL